jgi:hypothetical protein
MTDDDDAKLTEEEHFTFAVEDAKRHFGEWDMEDPVVWAILRVVEAQSNLAHAIDMTAYAIPGIERGVEQAIAERLEAIAALQRAIEQEPRSFQ